MTLFEAVHAGDLAALKAALSTTRDVNALGPGGRTPLIVAAAAGRTDLVKALLEAGAEPAWRDETDETALLVASANGHAETARLLAPHASDDERDQAAAFLQAFGASHGPDFQYDGTELQKTAATLAARAANFFGDEDPAKRMERIERSKKKGR